MFNMPKEKVFTTGKLKLDGNSKEYPHTTKCQHPMCIQTTCKPPSPTHASITPEHRIPTYNKMPASNAHTTI